jgi:hypothetical protein
LIYKRNKNKFEMGCQTLKSMHTINKIIPKKHLIDEKTLSCLSHVNLTINHL